MSIALQEIVDILRKLPTKDKEAFLRRLAELADSDIPSCPVCGGFPKVLRLPEEILVPFFVISSPKRSAEYDIQSVNQYEIMCRTVPCAFSPKTRDHSLAHVEELWRQAILVKWENDLRLVMAERDLVERSPESAP